jgi:hypothetical protein
MIVTQLVEIITDEQMQLYARALDKSLYTTANSLLNLNEYEKLKLFKEWLDEQMPKRIT